jgi:hypothetical protein
MVKRAVVTMPVPIFLTLANSNNVCTGFPLVGRQLFTALDTPVVLSLPGLTLVVSEEHGDDVLVHLHSSHVRVRHGGAACQSLGNLERMF